MLKKQLKHLQFLRLSYEYCLYLGLGSNLGQRQQNIELALEALNQINDISLHSIATYYETMAVATVKQPNYLNSAAKISTFLTPIELLDITESIEVDLGRDTKGFGDPRIIDIDILFYNDDISTDRLTIPHPSSRTPVRS